ncbi:MAG: hypothetical protein JWQ98_2894 [Chlorobi bacterium]|nr:hypothetical protein [Chlorobiota bacterium]
MNTIFSWRAFICAVLLALPVTATAQRSDETAETTSTPIEPIPLRARFLIGPRVGANRNFHSGGFRTISEADCPKFAQGSGFGYLAGLTAEYVGGSHWGMYPGAFYDLGLIHVTRNEDWHLNSLLFQVDFRHAF